MALANCKECRSEVALSALQCPRCGALVPGYSDAAIRSATVSFLISQVRFGLWIIVLVGLALRFAVAELMAGSIFSIGAAQVGGWFVVGGLIGLLVFEFGYFIFKKLS